MRGKKTHKKDKRCISVDQALSDPLRSEMIPSQEVSILQKLQYRHIDIMEDLVYGIHNLDITYLP